MEEKLFNSDCAGCRQFRIMVDTRDRKLAEHEAAWESLLSDQAVEANVEQVMNIIHGRLEAKESQRLYVFKGLRNAMEKARELARKQAWA